MSIARDIRLSVSAELAIYRRDMAKMPDITEKQATASARRLEVQIVKAQGAAAVQAIKAGKKAAKGYAGAFSKIHISIGLGDIKRAATAVFDLAQHFADLRNEVADASVVSGVAAETLAGLRVAAESSGQEFTGLNEGLKALPKRLMDARNGTGEAAKALDALGLTQERLNGDLADNDAALKEIIKQLQAVKDPSLRAGLAVGALGESGGKMMQAVGGTELQLFIDRADQFGTDIGPRAAESASRWQMAMADLSLVIGGTGSGLMDYVPITAFVENATLGLVIVTEALSQSFENVKTKTIAAAMALSGDLAGSLEYYQQHHQTQIEMGAAIKASADEFLAQRKAILKGAEASKETAAAVAESADETDRGTASTAAYTAAQREAAKALREGLQVIKAQRDALQSLGDFVLDSQAKQLTGREAIDFAFQREINRLADLRDASEDTATAQMIHEMAVLELTKDFHGQYLAFEEAEEEAHLKSLDVQITAERKAHRTRLQMLNEREQLTLLVRDAALEAASEVTMAVVEHVQTQKQEAWDAAKASVDARISELESKKELTAAETKMLKRLQRKKQQLAIKDFRNQQKMMAIQAVIAGALAAITMSLPPPGGIGFPQGLYAAGITTVASLATIALQRPPQFYQGTGRAGAPDANMAELHRGEGVANQRAMGVDGFAGLLQALNNQGQAAVQQHGQVLRAVISQRSVSDGMLQAAAGDGQLGALLGPPSPGYYPGLR